MNIDQFLKQTGLESFLDELGLAGLDEATRTEHTRKILEILHNKLKLRFLALVKEEDKPFLENMQNIDELLVYMEDKKGIDFDQIAVEEAMQLREELIGTVEYVKGAMSNQSEQD